MAREIRKQREQNKKQLTRILQEGGRTMLWIYRDFNHLIKNQSLFVRLQFILFGFTNKLASHLERSPLIHSYGYESAGDRPTCFASLPLKSKSLKFLMQYPG
jgi:hypothetical protein